MDGGIDIAGPELAAATALFDSIKSVSKKLKLIELLRVEPALSSLEIAKATGLKAKRIKRLRAAMAAVVTPRDA